MKGKDKKPTIEETVTWIESHHKLLETSQYKRLPPWCELCGGSWPCASKRMAVELRRLWKQPKTKKKSKTSSTKKGSGSA